MVGAKCLPRLGMAKKSCFHTSQLLPTQFSLKTNFITAMTVITCVIYAIFGVQKVFFFMAVVLPYNQHNNMTSLIFQVVIDPYLIHSVHPPFPALLAGTWQGINVLEGCSERGGDLFQGWDQFLHKK